MGKEEKIKAVVSAVVELFLETGKDSTVKEIAVKLGWTESKVRTVIRSAPCSVPDGLIEDEDVRPSHSTGYTHMQSGVHKVNVYSPTRETLRQMILSARKAAIV